LKVRAVAITSRLVEIVILLYQSFQLCTMYVYVDAGVGGGYRCTYMYKKLHCLLLSLLSLQGHDYAWLNRAWGMSS
jgi:hypothetical protein